MDGTVDRTNSQSTEVSLHVRGDWSLSELRDQTDTPSIQPAAMPEPDPRHARLAELRLRLQALGLKVNAAPVGSPERNSLLGLSAPFSRSADDL